MQGSAGASGLPAVPAPWQVCGVQSVRFLGKTHTHKEVYLWPALKPMASEPLGKDEGAQWALLGRRP